MKMKSAMAVVVAGMLVAGCEKEEESSESLASAEWGGRPLNGLGLKKDAASTAPGSNDVNAAQGVPASTNHRQKATSAFVMEFRRAAQPDQYKEMFNTGLYQWRGKEVEREVMNVYRSMTPASTVPDAELSAALRTTQIELQPNSRVITITVDTNDECLSVSLANAYAQAIEHFTNSEKKARCDSAVSQIHERVEGSRRAKDQLATSLQEFRSTHKIDLLRHQMDTAKNTQASIMSEILQLEAEEGELSKWLALLASVTRAPERFGEISADDEPRAREFATEYKQFQTRSAEYNKLINTFSERHPDVINKAGELDAAKRRFLASVSRAYDAALVKQTSIKRRLEAMRGKQGQLQGEVANLSQRVGVAESQLLSLESEYKTAIRLYESLLLDEQKARAEAESLCATINIVGRASFSSVH